MKALKVLGVAILLLIVLFFVVSLFLPSKLHVEDSILIHNKAAVLFKQVNNYKNWESWSPWRESDPAMQTVYQGPAFGVNSSYSWRSKVHGDGKLTIIESIPYTRVSNELVFIGGPEKSRSDFTFEETADGTKVTWSLDIPHLTYPVERYFGLVMPKTMKKFFKSGLENLKKVSENMPGPPEISLTSFPETKIISILDSCNWQDYGQKMGAMFGELMTFLSKSKTTLPNGPAMTIYSKWDEAAHFTIFEAVIPVNEEVKGSGRVTYKIIPETKALKGTHHGRYEDIGPLYMAMDEYVKEFGLTEGCCPMEAYITDPTMEPDTSKWLTDVYFLIQ
jgi:effector-binding domain-containing protein